MRLERVGQQVREQLAQLVRVALDRRQVLGQRARVDVDVARAATWLSAIEIASRTTSASAMRSTCSRIGRTKSSTSSTMALAILASLMMSREDRLRVLPIRRADASGCRP